MTPIFEIAVGLLLVIGASFAFVAALGLLRLPDVYMRMHAGSKAGTLGSGLMLIALALHAQQLDVFTRALAGVVFFLLTAPVSAHLLAKASLQVGYRPCSTTLINQMPEQRD